MEDKKQYEHTSVPMELLIRLDERIVAIQKELVNINGEISELHRQISSDKVDERNTLKAYVTKEEFSPIQKTLYTIATLIIMTVVGTLLSLVINKGGIQ